MLQALSFRQNNTIGKWARTPEENKFAVALDSGGVIKNLNNAGMDKLSDLVGKWLLYIGEELSPNDIIMNVEFIHQHFGDLTLREIDLAIELSVAGKLEVNAETYKKGFTPLYASRILNAYKEYKNEALQDLIRRKNSSTLALPPASPKPTPEQEMKLMKEILQDEYNAFKKKNRILDPFNFCYDFLKRTKRLKGNKALTLEATTYGKAMAAAQLLKTSESLRELWVPESMKEDDKEVIRFARNFYVQKYFEKTEINILLESIKIEEFT